jgi:hypothetical protein
MQDDLRRLGEKINNLSLSHNAGMHFRQEFERRRENDKVIQEEFHDRKPRLQGETFGPRATRDINNTNRTYNPPRMDSLAPRSLSHSRDAPLRSHSRLDETFLLAESDFSSPPQHLQTNDFIDRQQASLLPPPLSINSSGGGIGIRSHTTSLNTDLGGYPFSANEVQWPVPPGYSESNHSWREGRESTVLGEAYHAMDFEGRGGGVGAGEARNGNANPNANGNGNVGMQGAGVRMSPRRVRDRNGWD